MVTYRFENGTVVTTAQEFVDFVEQDYQKDLANGVEWEWNTDYAFAAFIHLGLMIQKHGTKKDPMGKCSIYFSKWISNRLHRMVSYC